MDHEHKVELLAALLEAESPDPADVLEDEPVLRMGLRRHPHLSHADWRRIRVQALDAEWERRLPEQSGD